MLFLFDQILHGSELIQEPDLAWSVDMDLMGNVQEMIRMEVDEDRSRVFVNLTEEHWLLLLSIAKMLYEATGTVNTMSKEDYGRYVQFLRRPVSVNSEQVTASVEKI